MIMITKNEFLEVPFNHFLMGGDFVASPREREVSNSALWLIGMGSLPIPKDGNAQTLGSLPVPAQENPNGFSRVAPVLMNRRRHVGKAAALGVGNSVHLKWVPYPFQMSDAIPLSEYRVFAYVLLTGCQSVASQLHTQRICNLLAPFMQIISNQLATYEQLFCNYQATL
jgi:hypothetical protein